MSTPLMPTAPQSAPCPQCAQSAADPANSPYFFSAGLPPKRPTMAAFDAAYRLRNGATGTLPLIADSSSAVVVALLEQFGEQLRSVSVKRARPAGVRSA